MYICIVAINSLRSNAVMDWLRRIVRTRWPRRLIFGGTLMLLLLVPLTDKRPGSPQAEFDHARQLFLHGYLEMSQQEADQGYKQYLTSDPGWAAKFSRLEAKDMLWRNMYGAALRLIDAQPSSNGNNEDKIERLAIEGVAYTRLHRFAVADETLARAESYCTTLAYSACGSLLRARGILAMERGKLPAARHWYLQCLSFARSRNDRWLAANALLNLGWVALEREQYDEAVDWTRPALLAGIGLGNENLVQGASGNLGWAYFRLGDKARALGLFLDAEAHAKKLGNLGAELNWLSTAGYVYRDEGDLGQASQSYLQSLALAKQIDSKSDIVDSLEDLAQIAIDLRNPDDAKRYVDEATPLIRATGNRLDELDILFAQGRIAAARREDKQAESIFETIQRDPASQTSMRLGAGHELAKLYETEGNTAAADRTYKATLATFEAARNELKNEDSKLPFLANATGIYDDYIGFLVSQGKPRDALAAADRSRARTLEQGLGIAGPAARWSAASLHPATIARKTGSTLLFYWLGKKQSYLWAITPAKIALFPLPAESAIAPVIDRYTHTLQGPEDPLESGDEDGRSLYQMLVAPAKALIRPDSRVVILADGVLSKLNFETLIVPGPGGPASQSNAHYWIEDVTLVSAPSLLMMANHRTMHAGNHKLLILGNAVSADPDYPELPMAAREMREVEKHFRPGERTVFSLARATPAAYLASAPERYGYIHFVTHATASSTDPLDSAIVLSPNPAAGNSFKLYARQILARPIDARLVTISACYGSGLRSYAGEGLVGLSWAFLRAGAHNVIGALWEVSDESTPRLMDTLYRGLGQGMTPADALRNAKLGLLHSHSSFRRPYFWAPFQLYSGL